MARDYVLIDRWTSNDEKETDLYIVPRDAYNALTAYHVGVDPRDETMRSQIHTIAESVAKHGTPTPPERREITARWVVAHCMKADLQRWSCTDF